MRLQAEDIVVAAGPARPRGAAPDPLLDQRAVGRLPPLLDAHGLRRQRAVRAPAVQRLDPVPAGAGDQVDRASSRWSSSCIGAFMDTSPVLAAVPAAGAALAGDAVRRPGRASSFVLRASSSSSAIFWFMSRGGIDTYFPDDIKTRFTDVWGQDHVLDPGQGEHRLPGAAAGDRGQGRLRAQRHPAVGPARHRQDADGRGGRRRDRQAVRVRRSGRLQQHVLRRRHPQGEGRCSASCASSPCATAA